MQRFGKITLFLCIIYWLISCSTGSPTVSSAPEETIAPSPTPQPTLPPVTNTLQPSPAPTAPAASPATVGFSVRFYGFYTNNGNGVADSDRIKIPLGPIDSQGRITSSRPVNVSGDMTLEFWMKANPGDNDAPPCDSWYYGNIVIDRDVYGDGDYGDYGVAICGNKLVVGFNVGQDDRLLKGNAIVTDGQWHHIAITRSASGPVRLYVDGQLDSEMDGPPGRIDYRLNRPTSYPASDPYLVFGAEKHDVTGSRYFNGWLDDLRLSNIVRYSGAFARPTAPHALDANTVALYRFDEGSGTTINDATAGNQSPGELKPRAGGAAQHWSSDTPFTTSSVPLTPRAYIPFIANS
ncbi:LamG domain-containing protein [Chloroflexus sp.]|uniref:LamG domain-containing protein n=1 Tax=Chloroflexus sp. TaxID=1904827 RepID=UPI002ADE8AD3|nr:LamG domain-containing protein [Chloroflexus sp.]